MLIVGRPFWPPTNFCGGTRVACFFAADTAAATDKGSPAAAGKHELAPPAASSTRRLLCDIIPAWMLNFFVRPVAFH